jgi:hypothetical protein
MLAVQLPVLVLTARCPLLPHSASQKPLSLSIYQIDFSHGKKQASASDAARMIFHSTRNRITKSAESRRSPDFLEGSSGLTFPLGLSCTQSVLSFTQTTSFPMDIANRRVRDNTPRSLPDESA